MAGSNASKRAKSDPPKDQPEQGVDTEQEQQEQVDPALVGTVDPDALSQAHPLVGVAETVTGDPVTAEQHREAVREEYGQWVAAAAITHGGARAYNVGDPVPAANVERWGYDRLGLVVRREDLGQ